MKDNFSKQAGLYAKYRPTYPRELYDFILSNTTHNRIAWDCGTGSGQAAKEIAKNFEKVFATDISQKQIDNAVQENNIYYSVQPSEHTNFRDSSFDLITVAQALHWFRFEDFYKEVSRVARPEAIFAAWTYSLLRISKQIDALVDDHHFNTLGEYWDAERKYVDDEYRNVPFPFKKIETPAFIIECEWTLEELEGYLNTWSALQNFVAVNQYNPVEELMIRIKPFWHRQTIRVRFPIHLLAGLVDK